MLKPGVLFLTVLSGCSAITCLFALILLEFTIPFFIQKDAMEFFYRLRGSEDVLMGIATGWAFVVVSGFIFFYFRPVALALDKCIGDPPIKKRLIQSPLILSISTFFAWEISSIAATLRASYLFDGIGFTEKQAAIATLYVSWGFFIFIFSYFTSDYLVKKFFLPKLFPEGEVSLLFPKPSLPLKWRNTLIWFSTSFFPVYLLYVAYWNLSNKSVSEFQETQANHLGFFLLFVLLLGLTFLLSYIQGKNFQIPLENLAKGARAIQESDFSQRVFIHSADELGILGDNFNQMARSLAEKESIKESFGKAVDPRIRDILISDQSNGEGVTSVATVLFCDLRDFTSISEKRAPKEVVFLLNRYFTLMTEQVEFFGGYVNKFIGDAILAVFGSPIPLENHAESAFLCALQMQNSMHRLNQEKEKIFPNLEIGIGMHTGELVSGSIGSPNRREYTVIGDSVNTASRIESLCKTLKSPLLVSETTWKLLSIPSQAKLKSLGFFPLKGKEAEVQLFGP